MKTNKVLAAMLLMGGLFSMKGQNVASTATLTSGGNSAGTAGSTSVYYGHEAGKVCTSGSSQNTFIGSTAGRANTSGGANFFGGSQAGQANTTGGYNVYLGYYCGVNATTGQYNTFLGANSGATTGNGSYNTYIGYGATAVNTDGSNNVGIGAMSSARGSNNICIGNYASTMSQSNKLIIDNSYTSTPLIWGDFTLDQLKFNGKVGIGGVTTFPNTAGSIDVSNYKLVVNGGVLATEVRVATNWADYVFEDDYALPTLSEVECFIDENGHLPNVPSAKQVAEEGISVGEMAKIQQEKIEELTLYIIAQDKQLKDEQQKNDAQQKEINELKALVQSLVDKK